MIFDFKNKKFINNAKEYEISFLEEIDCSTMDLIKCRWRKGKDTVDHCRNIYYDKNTNLYYKIWNKTYIHNESFTTAMKNNIFYNDLILPLKSLIFDKEYICRGYITFGGSISKKELTELPELYKKFKKNILDSKWVFIDPAKKNIIKYKEKYCFIDFEAIYPLEKFKIENNKLKVESKLGFYNEVHPLFFNDYLIQEYFS